MRADNAFLAVTTTVDEITGEVKPLFGFPVQIAQAVDSSEPSFDIAAPSGAKRQQFYKDPVTNKEVGDDECRRGVFVGDQFHEIPVAKLDEIKAATKITTMTVLGSMPLFQVPFERTTGTYYLQPPPGSAKAMRIVFEALCGGIVDGNVVKPMALVTKRTPKSRQALAVIWADEEAGVLMMSHLRFASQLKEPDEQVLAIQVAQVSQEQCEMARTLVCGMADGRKVLADEHDDLLALREELIEQALAGDPLTAAPLPMVETSSMDSLEQALEMSLAAL